MMTRIGRRIGTCCVLVGLPLAIVVDLECWPRPGVAVPLRGGKLGRFLTPQDMAGRWCWTKIGQQIQLPTAR